MLKQNKRPWYGGSNGKPKTMTDRWVNSSSGLVSQFSSNDDFVTYRIVMNNMKKELDYKNVRYYFKPDDANAAIPGIFSLDLRADLSTFQTRMRVDPNDVNMDAGLDHMADRGRFTLDPAVEVEPDVQHVIKLTFVQEAVDSYISRFNSICYYDKFDARFSNTRYNINHTGAVGTRGARLAAAEAVRDAFPHDAVYIRPLNHTSDLAERLRDPGLGNIVDRDYNDQQLIIEINLINERRNRDRGMVESVRQKAGLEYEAISTHTSKCLSTYNDHTTIILETLNKFLAPPIIDSVLPLLNQHKFREAERQINDRFGVNTGGQTVIDAFLNVMTALKFNPNKMDITEFLNIFELLAEVLTELNVVATDAMKLHWLKNCMKLCNGAMSELNTLYNAMTGIGGVVVNYEEYARRLRLIYTRITNDKIMADEESAKRLNINTNYHPINAANISQYSSSNYSNNTAGKANNSGGRGFPSGGKLLGGRGNFSGGNNNKGQGGGGRGTNRARGTADNRNSNGPSYYGPSSGSSFGCFVCGQPGHFARNCPVKEDNDRVNAVNDNYSPESGSSNISLADSFRNQYPKSNSGGRGTSGGGRGNSGGGRGNSGGGRGNSGGGRGN